LRTERRAWDHRPGKKIGVDLDHLGRQQDGLVGSQLVDPTARLADRNRDRRQQVVAALAEQASQSMSAAVICCITGEIARRKAGICPTFSGLMASGSPAMTGHRGRDQGIQIAHGRPRLHDAAELAEHRVVGLGGVGQQRAFQLELVVLVRDEGDFLQRIEGHAVQLDQHLGVALRGVDAFQAQEALRQRLREDADLGGHAVGVGRLERCGEAGGIQKLEGTEVQVGGVVRACRQRRGRAGRIGHHQADTLGWARK
jgi:hypothetical protein